MADVAVVAASVRPYPADADLTSAPFLGTAGAVLTAGMFCYYDEDLGLWYATDTKILAQANFSAVATTGGGTNGNVGLMRPSLTPFSSKIYLGVGVAEGQLYALSPSGAGKICPIADLYVAVDSPANIITPIGIGDADNNVQLFLGYSGVRYTGT